MRPYIPLAVIPLALAGGSPAEATSQWQVYVGTYAEGIYRLTFDTDSGELTRVGLACEIATPSFLALHPGRPLLYAVSETVNPPGTVAAYRVDRVTGDLTPINVQPSEGQAPCHLSVAPSGKHVAIANYVSGTVALLPIGANGGLEAASAVVKHQGSGTHPQRQEAPHAHSVNFDAAGRFLYAADLGIDQVRIYRYDAGEGSLVPAEPDHVTLAPGAGPRHLAWHPNGQHAYVVNELDSTVTAFAVTPSTGALHTIDSVSTLPPDFDGESTTAEIRVHPSGRFVYASNRGHDSIAVFSVDADSGALTPVGHCPSGGKTPRNFNIDPTGRYLLAANQGSDNIVVFEIDLASGMPKPVGRSVMVPKPVCVVFQRMGSN